MAYTINRVTILGNVGREVELRQTHTGKSVASIVVGTDKRWTDRQNGEQKSRTTWHKVVAWDALADMCAKTMVTGSKVYVDGELLYEDYTAKDGTPRQKAFIKADQVVVLSNKEAVGLRRAKEPGPQPVPSTAPTHRGSGWDETHAEAEDGGLPF